MGRLLINANHSCRPEQLAHRTNWQTCILVKWLLATVDLDGVGEAEDESR